MKQALQLTPNQLLYQQKRFRGKINVKKPRIYYKKAVLNKLLMPFVPNPIAGKSLDEICLQKTSSRAEKPLNPYEEILAKEIRNWFDQSKMVACLHVNSIPQRDVFEIQVPLFKANMYYKQYEPKLVSKAIENSPYKDLRPLLSRYTAFVFSPDINVRTLEKIIKKCKKMFTLGGILEGYILSSEQFSKFGEMNITSLQMGLVQLLQNAGGGNLNHQLTYHQSTLVTRLKQIGANETTSTNDTVSNENQ